MNTADTIGPRESSSNSEHETTSTPLDASARQYNSSLVKAKNEVYEAVGVTERKPDSHVLASTFQDAADGRVAGLMAEALDRLGELESELGDALLLFAELWHILSTQWLVNLRTRIVAGTVDSSTPFTRLISIEWENFRKSSATGRLAFFTAGIEVELLAATLDGVSRDLVDKGMGMLRDSIGEKEWVPGRLEQAERAVSMLQKWFASFRVPCYNLC